MDDKRYKVMTDATILTLTKREMLALIRNRESLIDTLGERADALEDELSNSERIEHARWIRLSGSPLGWSKDYKCSKCGRTVSVRGDEPPTKEYPYCNCGARMDEAKTK